MFGVPLVLEMHDSPLHELDICEIRPYKAKLIEWLLHVKLGCAKRIVAVTQNIRNALSSAFGFPYDRIKVIPNAANTELFKPFITECPFKTSHSEDCQLVIGFVGNLHSLQGVDLLVEASVKVLSSLPNALFVIVGEGSSKNELIKDVLRRGVNENFHFTGEIKYKDVPMYINSFDIVVAPIRPKKLHDSGSSALKIFEYMACAKPVIASRLSGLEFIESEGVGVLIPPDDSDALASAILDLAQNADLRVSMGEKARRAWVGRTPL